MTGHEGLDDPRGEAEGELSQARLALHDDDREHAAAHLSRALQYDPTLPDALELLTVLGDLDLFPAQAPLHAGTAAARAHLLAARGRPGEALDLLAAVQRHEPRKRWADVPWVHDPEVAAQLKSDDVVRLIERLVGIVPDPIPDDERAPFEPYVTLVRGAVNANDQNAELLSRASMFVRRLGSLDEAAAWAERAEQIDPSVMTALALANAHRRRERWEDAEQAYLRALSYSPNNPALMTDLGEMLAKIDRFDDGLAWVERALEIDPADISAFPTACGMRFERDGDLAHLVALGDYLSDHPDNGHAHAVLADHSHDRYWLGPIPPPSEAISNMFAQIVTDTGGEIDGISIETSLTEPEPPSALLAFRRAIPAAKITITGSGDPHPWLTIPEQYPDSPPVEVRRQVWSRRGKPSAGSPSSRSREKVAAYAKRPWQHLPGAYDDAVQLSGLPLDDLLGVLVHPPAPDKAIMWPYWLRRVQAWACLGIAHYRTDEAWPNSTRRTLLVSLAYGPEDWVSEAALLALVATAWMQPSTREDVVELVARRFFAAIEAEKTRSCPLTTSFAHLVRATPAMPTEILDLATEIISEESANEDE